MALLFENNIRSQHQLMRAYYKQHARMYEMTRWSFLFGRKNVVQLLTQIKPKAHRILEVGCGTGFNLVNLAKYYPHAHITGIDLSQDMIAQAEENTIPFGPRVQTFESAFLHEGRHTENFWDVILFSYTLSMINPQWEQWIDHAHQLLAKGGCIAVVDFHDTPNRWFERHMQKNHVRMGGHLNDELCGKFFVKHDVITKAYGGLWKYFTFLGYKR